MNPLYQREKLRLSRKPECYRIAFIVNLFLLLLLFFLTIWGENHKIFLAFQGLAIFSIYFFLASCLIIPVYAAASVSGEREGNRLEMLMASGLSVTDLVSGKFGSLTCRMLFILFLSMPVQMIMMLFGNLHILVLIRLNLFLVSFICFLVTFCMLLSCRFQSSIRSVSAAYVLVLSWLGGLTFLSFVCARHSGMTGIAGKFCADVLLLFNPFTSLLILIAETSGNQYVFLRIINHYLAYPTGAFLQAEWILSCLMQMGLVVFLIRRCAVILKKEYS